MKGLKTGGRKKGSKNKLSRDEKTAKQTAEEIARNYLEKNIKTIMDSYLTLIKGRLVKHFDKVTGSLICEEEVIDSPAVRDAVKKILPDRAPEDRSGNAVMPEWSLTIKRATNE